MITGLILGAAGAALVGTIGLAASDALGT